MKRIFSSLINPFSLLLFVIISTLISSHSLTCAQYPERIEELTKKLEVLNKQLEACGTNIGCVQSKMAQIQQLTQEIQFIQQELNKDPEKLSEGFASNLPKENEFPPPFDVISKPWIEHVMPLSTILKLDCDYITNSRVEIADWLDEIYKKGRGLNGPGWPLLLAKCEETSIKLNEYGILDESDMYYLKYNMQFVDKAVWLVKYNLIVGERHMKVHDKHYYALGLADNNKRNTAVLSYDGWILDQSKDPPVKKPLIRYEILEEEVPAVLGWLYVTGYTMIFPVIVEDPKDKYKIGKVTEYRLSLPVQTVRFYTANPDEYIDTYVETPVDAFSPEEVQGFFDQGNFKKSYTDGSVRQDLEIGSISLDCDETESSENGAIVLAGDCIDHGGYVIASDNITTTVNGKPIARIGDKVLCFKHGKGEIVASANTNVLNMKKQIARIGDKTSCGGKIIGGSMDTFAGDK